MEPQESRWLDGLVDHVGLHADAAQIADAIVSTLRDIEAVLHPVIGRGGFDALYTRCVYLTGLAHPWLTGAREPAATPVDLGGLTPVLAHRTSAEAAAGGVALLQTFNDLLTTLIGSSLTQQLLRSVAEHTLTLALTLGARAAQDTAP